MSFFKMYRKKGFQMVLEILQKNKIMTEKDFLKEIVKDGNAVNDFYRSRSDLIKYNIISFELNEDNNKQLFLTEKGKSLIKMINSIEDLFFQ